MTSLDGLGTMSRAEKGFATLVLVAFVVVWAVGFETTTRQSVSFVALGLGSTCLLALFAEWSAGRSSTAGRTWFVRVYFAALGFVALVAVHSLSVPGWDPLLLGFVAPALLVMLAIWFVVVLLGLVQARLDGRWRDTWREQRVRWCVPPVLVVGLVVVAWFGVPLRVRFELSRSELDALAEHARHERALVDAELEAWQPGEVHFVGTYPVTRIETFDGGVRFLVARAGFVDAFGFAYSERGVPPNLSGDEYERLAGEWYVWRWIF
ncbi:MAG: hypothetical protein L6Q99_04335 [Planctomycetes bacterium]|nr:hypothetical protein [Planctomycetota bacterium]